jgi:hypothetical protein
MWTGDAAEGYVPQPDGKKALKITSYPVVKSTRIDLDALKTKYPEIAEELTVKGQYRRLNISIPKTLKQKWAAEKS